MGKNIHTVTIGTQTFTRESDSRAYTHAVVVTVTEAERADRVGKAQAEIDALEGTIATCRPVVSDPANVAAYAAARARFDYLQEEVEEPLRGLASEGRQPLIRDGQVVMHKSPRYLSDSFIDPIEDALPANVKGWQRGGHARDLACAQAREARATLEATPQGALEKATRELEGEPGRPQYSARARLENAKARYVVGSVTCENWSQSAKGAAKLADDVRKHRPLADVRVTSDIQTRTRATRAKAAK